MVALSVFDWERDQEGARTGRHDQEAVGQADQETGAHAERHRRREAEIGDLGAHGDDAGEPDHRGHRHVEVAGDEQRRLAEADDA